MSTLRKYLAFGRVGWQDSLAYRGNAMVWMVVDSLPAFTMIFVWLNIYGENDSISGYDLPGMVTYYLLIVLLGVISTPHPEYNIGYDIRLGRVSTKLLRPASYSLYLAVDETAWMVLKSLLFLPLYLIMAWCFREYVVLADLTREMWLYGILSVVLAYVMRLAIKLTLGFCSFWLIDSGGMLAVYGSLAAILSGEIVPLELLPEWVIRMGVLLPFRYLLAFPASIFLGQRTTTEVMQGLTSQAVWTVGLSVTTWVIYRSGIRAHDAVGG